MKDEYGSCAVQAYMAVWHQKGASKSGGVSLKPTHKFEVFAIGSSAVLDAHLVLTTYAVTANAHVGEGILFVGQLHIRAPHGKKTSPVATRQRLVREALGIMTRFVNGRVGQSTVAVLCGDVNLNQDDADVCCQPAEGEPDVHTHWHTEAPEEGLSGEVAAWNEHAVADHNESLTFVLSPKLLHAYVELQAVFHRLYVDRGEGSTMCTGRHGNGYLCTKKRCWGAFCKAHSWLAERTPS